MVRIIRPGQIGGTCSRREERKKLEIILSMKEGSTTWHTYDCVRG